MIANFSVTHSKVFDDFIKKHLKIENFSVVPLTGDASTRKYYRVTLKNQSWILMEWEPFQNPAQFPFISIQNYWAEHNIQVPEIIAYNAELGLFLLEDLGDLTLERKFGEFSNQENILPFYKATLDQLITLHRLILQPHKDSDCTAFQIAFDTEKFSWELNYTFKNLFQILCPQKLTEQQEAQLQAEFTEIAQTLAGLPQVICHRDFHSRNVMIKAEKIVLIDFQDARKGPPQYDLVSLVHDSYVTLTEQSQNALIDYYLKNFPEVLKMFESREDFMHYFTLQTLQRCFKACGTFAAILNQRGDRRYLKHLPHTLAKVRAALKELDCYPMISMIVKNLQLPQIEKWP
jgi:aminoglycoside/choline kinase family phosphotransferase